MKTNRKYILYAILASGIFVLGVCVFRLVHRPYWPESYFVKQDEIKKILLSEEAYQETAVILARYCQSVDKELQVNLFYSGAFLPATIRDYVSHGRISPDGGGLEMHGGFDHYGYMLRPGEKDPATEKKAWTLSYYTENPEEKELCKVTLDRQDKFSKQELIQQSEDIYNNLLKTNPEAAGIHLQRIKLMFYFDEYDRALGACNDAINAVPDDYWPRLTRAFLWSYLGDEAIAITDFSQWVEMNPTFANYCYLFYFFKENGLKAQAFDTIEKALKCNLDTTGSGFNAYFFCQCFSVYAFENGEIDLAIKVCRTTEDPARLKEFRKTCEKKYIDFATFEKALKAGNMEKAQEWIEQNPCSFNLYRDDFYPWKKIEREPAGNY